MPKKQTIPTTTTKQYNKKQHDCIVAIINKNLPKLGWELWRSDSMGTIYDCSHGNSLSSSCHITVCVKTGALSIVNFDINGMKYLQQLTDMGINPVSMSFGQTDIYEKEYLPIQPKTVLDVLIEKISLEIKEATENKERAVSEQKFELAYNFREKQKSLEQELATLVKQRPERALAA